MQHAATRFLLPVSAFHRRFATSQPTTPKSSHAQLYSNTWPAMVPVFLLGSAVYLALQLTQMKLAHEKDMEQAENRIRQLEAEITTLEARRSQEIPLVAIPSGNGRSSSRRWW